MASTYVTGADGQQVGGDWFDVFELPSGQVAVAIGDVMGHDVDAAATMGQVRSALRSYAAVQDVCGAVLDSQLSGSRRDDVALLVVKVSGLDSSAEPATKRATATT